MMRNTLYVQHIVHVATTKGELHCYRILVFFSFLFFFFGFWFLLDFVPFFPLFLFLYFRTFSSLPGSTLLPTLSHRPTLLVFHGLQLGLAVKINKKKEACADRGHHHHHLLSSSTSPFFCTLSLLTHSPRCSLYSLIRLLTHSITGRSTCSIPPVSAHPSVTHTYSSTSRLHQDPVCS